MIHRWHPVMALLVICGLACSTFAKPKEVTDPAEAAQDPDFAIQGEYVGQGKLAGGTGGKLGAQVVAQGGGQFRVVIYEGGLPGTGWTRGAKQVVLAGKRENGVTRLTGQELSGTISDGAMTLAKSDDAEKMTLKKTERTSPTLAAEPPAGALILFDGANTDQWVKANVTPNRDLWAEARAKPLLDDCQIHLEFCLSWMPAARGQGRSNSGVYIHECYECQVLDSFGLEGRSNECGGIYKVGEPAVNMCLPPLAWQTYDIDFTGPKYKDGKKAANARVTIRHNGVIIHEDRELPAATPGGIGEGPGPRGLYLQGHGNKVQYRNIWAVKK